MPAYNYTALILSEYMEESVISPSDLAKATGMPEALAKISQLMMIESTEYKKILKRKKSIGDFEFNSFNSVIKPEDMAETICKCLKDESENEFRNYNIYLCDNLDSLKQDAKEICIFPFGNGISVFSSFLNSYKNNIVENYGAVYSVISSKIE